MGQKRLADGFRHPRGKCGPKRDKLLQSRAWKLVLERRQRPCDTALSQPCESAYLFAGNGRRGKQHPLRRMLHLDDLSTEPEPPVRAGCQIHKLCWNLRRKTERVRRGGAMRSDGFRSRGCNTFDNFLSCRRSHSKTRLDRPDVDASADPHQLFGPVEALKCLINGRAASKVQEFLEADQRAFWQCVGVAQNLLGNGRHCALVLSEMYSNF